MPDIAVIGAGVSGLTAAWTMRQRGVDVEIFEASDRVGGKLRTEHPDGLLIDAGPDSFLSTKPAALNLIQQLGLADQVINTRADGGGTFILRDGKLMPLPEGITLLVPAEIRAIAKTPLLSPFGKVRMVAEYLIPPGKSDADESIGSFVRRRVGNEAFERMAEPLLSGIYAGDADQLSLLATFPRLRQTEREHGGVVRGALAQRRQAQQRPAAPRKHTPFVSMSNGLGQFTTALADAIGSERIHFGTSVTGIDSTTDGYAIQTAEGTQVSVRGVVFATPAPVTSTMVAELDPELARTLSGIPYVSTATVSLAFDAADVSSAQAGRGFVIPRAERRMLTAVTWTSNKFAGRAPEGTALLRAFVGRAGDDAFMSLSTDELIKRVRRELHDILGISATPTFARVFSWPNAMPQYILGHIGRLQRIDRRLAQHPGLALTGAAYRGVGIPDCISDATLQSNNLLERLGYV